MMARRARPGRGSTAHGSAAHGLKAVFLVGLVLAMTGCDHNARKNERDGAATLRPGEQGDNDRDLGITREIRRAVVKSDALSVMAKNIRISTADGMVTLRGPVESDKEKADLVAIARDVVGVRYVDNQLELGSKAPARPVDAASLRELMEGIVEKLKARAL